MNHSVRRLLGCACLALLTACPLPQVGFDDAGAGGGGGEVAAGGGTGTGGGDAVGGGAGTLDPDGGAGGGTAAGGGNGTGGGNSTGGGAGRFDAGTSLDEALFCDAWAQAYCDREARCLTLDPAQNSTCLARVKDACATWHRQVTAGVFHYDPAIGAACVGATANSSCAAGRGFTGGALAQGFGNGPVACDALVVGAGPAGTPCTSTADCAAGLNCPAMGFGACRVCVALPTVGQLCNPGGTGCFNAACRGAGDGGNECFAWLQSNEVCSGTGQCDPATTRGCALQPADGGVRLCVGKDPDGIACTAGTACLGGYCNAGNLTDAGVRTCGTVADGTPCGATADCAPTSFCSGLGAARPGVCSARLALGATCSIWRADPNDGCVSGAGCFDGVCKPRENQQAVGQQCRATLTDCAMGAYCPNLPTDGGYPSCLAQGGTGAACGNSPECQPGLRCTNNTCQPLAGAGQQCFAAQQCKATLTCPLGDAGLGFYACAPVASPGADCAVSGVVCASGVDDGQGGFCLRDAGVNTGPGTCSAPLGLGADCGSSAQCASARCLQVDGGTLGAGRGVCQPSCLP